MNILNKQQDKENMERGIPSELVFSVDLDIWMNKVEYRIDEYRE